MTYTVAHRHQHGLYQQHGYQHGFQWQHKLYGTQASTQFREAAQTEGISSFWDVTWTTDTKMTSWGSTDNGGLSRRPHPEKELFSITDIPLLLISRGIMLPSSKFGGKAFKSCRLGDHPAAPTWQCHAPCLLQPAPMRVTASLVLPSFTTHSLFHPSISSTSPPHICLLEVMSSEVCHTVFFPSFMQIFIAMKQWFCSGSFDF